MGKASKIKMEQPSVHQTDDQLYKNHVKKAFGEAVKLGDTNKTTDQKAAKLIKPFQGMVAWPTVIMGFLIIIGFGTICTLATLRIIPLWAGLTINSIILYLAQTPLHEACHGNIAGRDKSKLWLNHLIGYLCGWVLIHEYKAFRAMHLAHHRETNDEALDPDSWVKVNGVWHVLFRCMTIVFYYNHFFFKNIAFKWREGNNKALALHIISSYVVIYSLMFWLAVFGWWREVLMLWLLPHYFASALIIYFFAYLPHKPHKKTERYRDTNIFLLDRPFKKLKTWAFCFQNFHLIHHLYPRIPFYLYEDAYQDVKPLLNEEQAPIIHGIDHDLHSYPG